MKRSFCVLGGHVESYVIVLVSLEWFAVCVCGFLWKEKNGKFQSV